jgi:hypothetical protein
MPVVVTFIAKTSSEKSSLKITKPLNKKEMILFLGERKREALNVIRMEFIAINVITFIARER